MLKKATACFAAFLCLEMFSSALACFGPKLKVGVSNEGSALLASYAIGYLIEEKTGIEPEFVTINSSFAEALKNKDIYIILAPPDAEVPESASASQIGEIAGMGSANIWIRTEMKDDLRFFTVERAIGLLPRFFSSKAYKKAAKSNTQPKKAARQAVLNAD